MSEPQIQVDIDGETHYFFWPGDGDSYYSSRVPFVNVRSTRTKPLSRYWIKEACYGRSQADAGTDDVEIKRVSDSTEVADEGVVLVDDELFTATRIVAREATR